MNSIERVSAVIDLKSADHVPLGFYAVDCDTVSKVLGRKTYVRNKIGVQLALWEGRRDEVAEGIKKDAVDFYRKIGCADIILPKEAQELPPKDFVPPKVKKIADDKWEDPQGRIYQAVWHANEISCIHDPRPERTDYTVEEFEKPIEIKPPDSSCFEALDYMYEQLGKERYIPSLTGVVAIHLIGGTENGLFMYASAPEIVMASAKRAVELQNQADAWRIRKQYNPPGIFIDHDMAGTNGPLVSPGMFREMCFPFMAERIKQIKKYAPQVVLHSCGRTIPIMDMILDAGVNCYQSLQTTAGMEIGMLKEKYGKRCCFWGGVPVEELITGTPEDVRKSVRKAMEAGAGGGFILGPSHSAAYGTKYENFMAMIDEWDKLKEKYR